MSKIKGQIFDKFGQRFEIDNVDIFVYEISDRLLVDSYRYTMIKHKLWLELSNAEEKGFGHKAEELDEVFNEELAVNALNSMAEEIENRFDKEYHQSIIDFVNSKDLDVIKNRPKEL